MEKTNTHEDAWSKNSEFWIDIIRERRDRYRIELTDAKVIEAIGDVHGLAVVDAGCGEGYLSRLMHENGAAEVLGVDTCEPLIDAARHADPSNAVNYEVADIRDLPVPDDRIDVIVANHSINEVPDPDPAFMEFRRVLRVGGRLVMLMLHPAFFGWDSNSLGPEHYRSDRQGHKPYKVAGITSPAVATAHVGTLDDYLGGLCRAGFSITGFEELVPNADQIAADEWWAERSAPTKFVLVTATRN